MKDIKYQKNFIEVIHKIATDYPETVFCGSFGLVMNGLLDRPIKDLDILLDKEYPDIGEFYDSYRIGGGGSHEFMVGLDKIVCYKYRIKEVLIDALYNDQREFGKSQMGNWEVHNFFGMDIKVETPESAINVKKQYILNNTTIDSVLKHLSDLIIMGIDRKELVEIISKANILDKPLKDDTLLDFEDIFD